ncbi:MAG: hypothetical protein JW941_13445 [Candidatus Coatesbacteria bacterium]|nr:hypothetical protein [Candidatus Coatesbacteria bacterium]
MHHVIDLQDELGVYLFLLGFLAKRVTGIQDQIVGVWISSLDGVYKACSTSKSTFLVLSPTRGDFAPVVAGIDQSKLKFIRLSIYRGHAQENARCSDQPQEYGDVPVFAQSLLLVIEGN